MTGVLDCYLPNHMVTRQNTQNISNNSLNICDVLRDIVNFVQLKKCEKHPWRSITFSKVAG